MDGVSSAYAKTVIQHRLAHPVDFLGCPHKPLPNDVNRCCIGDQQHSGEKICFGLDPAIASALTVFSERRRTRMAKKGMCQLVADIAALAVHVMRVIVDERRPPAA